MPALPIIQYYNKMYAVSLGGNDQKAVHVFKNYEPQEKLRRLQSELVAVKNGKASEKACDITIGKKRAVKFQSYDNWAKLMLLWLSQSKPS